MSFRSGTVSWSRFRAFGEPPAGVDDALLKRLEKHIIEPPSVGTPPEFAAGWCAGRHVLDEDFSYDACGFGSVLLAGVRIDTNRVPAEIRRAYRAIAEGERAAGTETGFLSRAEVRAAREEAERRCAEELSEGRHRNSKLVPILWDLPSGRMLAPLNGERTQTLVRDLVMSTLELRLQPRTAGALAWDLLSDRGLTSELDDARPSILTPAPAERPGSSSAMAAESGERRPGAHPDVPWAAASPEPKDFLGNEFLLWLWWSTELSEGLVSTARGEIAVVIDRTLDLECAWGITGQTSIRGDAPTRRPEASKALQHGKWPRRCGLIISAPSGGLASDVRGSDDLQWTLTFQADRFQVSSAALPEIDEARSAREIIEQRIARMLALDDVLVALYDAFLTIRFSRGWGAHREQLSSWIMTRDAPPPRSSGRPRVAVLSAP